MLNNKYLKTIIKLKDFCEIEPGMRFQHRYTEQMMLLIQWEFYWILQNMSLVVFAGMYKKLDKQNTYVGRWMIKQFMSSNSDNMETIMIKYAWLRLKIFQKDSDTVHIRVNSQHIKLKKDMFNIWWGWNLRTGEMFIGLLFLDLEINSSIFPNFNCNLFINCLFKYTSIF